ncbi:hypothetical protein [Dokdonella sp.]|uniref:hypothetical protein n=1 Tax=Dokdonella sp. TaxID=2291710 RepID=UPI0025BAA5B8|nr:hypothetical protein [Dokdonella sp.]
MVFSPSSVRWATAARWTIGGPPCGKRRIGTGVRVPTTPCEARSRHDGFAGARNLQRALAFAGAMSTRWLERLTEHSMAGLAAGRRKGTSKPSLGFVPAHAGTGCFRRFPRFWTTPRSASRGEKVMRWIGVVDAFVRVVGFGTADAGAARRARRSPQGDVRCRTRGGKWPIVACARFALAAGMALSVAAPAQAADSDGYPDPSFNGNGLLRILFYSGVNASAYGVVVQPDGKIVLSGTCLIGDATSDSRVCMARVLPDGTIDHSFGPNGSGAFLFSDFAGFPAATSNDFIRQPDGRFVVVGTSYDPAHLGAWIARLSASGELERAPNGEPVRWLNLSANPTSPGFVTYGVAFAPGGKIVVAGTANSASDPGNWDMAVARLNPDLSLDTTFNASGAGGMPGVRLFAFDLGGGNSDRAYKVAVQPDGKIVAAGAANVALGPVNTAAVARVNADGTPDATFGSNGRVWFGVGPPELNTRAWAVALDSRQNVVLAGITRPYVSAYDSGYVARLRATDGALDTGFGDQGTGWTLFGSNAAAIYFNAVLVQPDGKIVAAGTMSDPVGSSFAYPYVSRLLPTGTDDATFADTLYGYVGPTQHGNDGAAAVAYDPRGYLVLAGHSQLIGETYGDMGVARLTSQIVFGGTGAGFDAQ